MVSFDLFAGCGRQPGGANLSLRHLRARVKTYFAETYRFVESGQPGWASSFKIIPARERTPDTSSECFVELSGIVAQKIFAVEITRALSKKKFLLLFQ